jgi:hypothetical protein
MSSRSRRLERVQSSTRGAAARALIPAVLVAIAVVAAGLWFTGALSGAGDGTPTAAPATGAAAAPDFVTSAPARVREAYAFAADNGAALSYIPCYCGCGGHSGHRNVRDCFIKHGSGDAVTFEEHGSQCDICVSIVLEAKTMLARGDSLAAVRASIDQAYADVGPGTDTPLPPGMEE